MIGVFDSGAGGLTVISELRRIVHDVDICFFADRKNAPYGTKSRRELIRLVMRNISRLCDAGADRILMACCTASTVYHELPRCMQRISFPIILPAARAAVRATRSGKIGVIATEATVRSSAFSSAISEILPSARVTELETQGIVSLVESGAVDGGITREQRERLAALLAPLQKTDIDTLILGCTHFPRLEGEIGRLLPSVRLISSSREGAREMIKSMSPHGEGKTIYL